MRPRQFDDAEVLRIAFDRFWRSGVRGTSLTDIARDAGVQRGSLYNAFGSKEALFLAAYRSYAADYLATIERALATGSLRERLLAFFDTAIRNFRAGSPPRGCPTTRGLMEIPAMPGGPPSKAMRAVFADLLRRLISMVERAFRDGLAQGEFHGDPEMAAAHLVTVARGLVVLDRAFGDEKQLRLIARHAVDAALRP